MTTITTPKTFSSHSIFSGIVETSRCAIKYLQELANKGELLNMSIENLGNGYKRETLCSMFYDGVIDARYPISPIGKQYREISHFRKVINKPIKYFCDEEAHTELMCFVEHIDYRVFSNEMLVFSITVNNSQLSLNEITHQNHIIRSVRNYNRGEISDDFKLLFISLQELLLRCDKKYNGDLSHSTFVGNKMYNYLLVKLDENRDLEYCDDLLYDLSCEYKIGTSQSSECFGSPDRDYKETILKNQSIACFSNWKGLVLNDTVCIMMKSSVADYQYRAWQVDYLEFIYMNIFYIKAYLVMMNKKYQNMSASSSLEKEYIEFERTFNFKNISYNFLPQLVYDRMRVGMEINDELCQLKEKIHGYSEKKERENEKLINMILFVMTFLTMTSAINDGVELFATNAMGEYNYWKIGLFAVSAIVAFILAIVIYRKLK